MPIHISSRGDGEPLHVTSHDKIQNFSAKILV